MTTCRRKEESVQAFKFDGTMADCGDMLQTIG